ncbi:DUF4136 domain-containing protein [Echinicola vietnamensis]|uniref:DUF4136 domain-containing protein n=1 Tax=Echinicola vietnamensis (strain DSM 17526 / LMG 23754 / KMM 6221) TaxID=926556 RepID=L0G0G5_ECHVK|nr:DUF4136 domain-containing protein [Echinicola vietnamensis]AGA79679.1 hypothetical protein Echvi_3463 [Echinicola vietnamensis DSM 17526]
MNIKTYTYTVLAAILTVTFSCTAGKVIDTNQAAGFSLENYKSFDFYKTDLEIDEMPEYAQRVEWIKEAIKANLSARGLQQDSANPEMLVNIGVFIEEKVQTRETDLRSDPPMYIGQRNYHWEVQEIPVGTYNEGTFTLDFVDKASNEMVWQGVGKSIITKKDEAAKKNIKEAAQKLFTTIE